jgi:hypothetical protein
MKCFGIVSVLACAVVLGAPAAPASAEDIFQLVSTALATYYSDRDVAEELSRIVLRERLMPEAISVLAKQGAGPLTLAALAALRQRSAALPSPRDAIVDLSTPTAADQRDMFHRVDLYARGYAHGLPNFLCASETRFADSGKRTDRPPAADKRVEWRHVETVTEDVRFADGADSYRTVRVNGKPDSRPMQDIREQFTRGDFGSILTITLDPASAARFFFDHWELLHGTRVAAFRYAIDQEHSQYQVCCTSAGTIVMNGIQQARRTKWISAYRGYIYAIPDSGVILRLTVENVDIPRTSDLSEGRHLFEYARVNLGGGDYWLPSTAIHYLRNGGYFWESRITFSNYHKFGADTSISFPTDK